MTWRAISARLYVTVHHEQTLKDKRVLVKHAETLGRRAAGDVAVTSGTAAREPFHRSAGLAQRKKAEDFFHRSRSPAAAQRATRHSAPAAVHVTVAKEAEHTARYYTSTMSMRPGSADTPSAAGPGRYCSPRHPSFYGPYFLESNGIT